MLSLFKKFHRTRGFIIDINIRDTQQSPTHSHASTQKDTAGCREIQMFLCPKKIGRYSRISALPDQAGSRKESVTLAGASVPS
jgi:hypothetical protein